MNLEPASERYARVESSEREGRPLPATGAGYLWVYEFVFDAPRQRQQLKCLTVIEEYTHALCRWHCSAVNNNFRTGDGGGAG